MNALDRDSLFAALPWMRFLPPADVDTMVAELAAAASHGDAADVAGLLADWRETAEIHADDPDAFQAATEES